MKESEHSSPCVVVKFDFEYKTSDGRKVGMREGEELYLLKKRNKDWWQVIRAGDRKPFYAPAAYVEEAKITELTKQKSEEYSPGKLCRRRSNSLDSKLFVKQLSKIEDFNSLKKIKTDSIGGKLHKQRISRDIWGRRKSWALEETLPPMTTTSTENIILEEKRISRSANYLSTVSSVHRMVKTFEKRKSKSSSNPTFHNSRSISDEGEFRILQEKQHTHTESSRPIAFNNPLFSSPSTKSGSQVSLEGIHTSSESISKEMKPKSLPKNDDIPIYANLHQLAKNATPPIPGDNDKPLCSAFGGWLEYEDASGRKYYHHPKTRQSSWKPPRRRSQPRSESSAPECDAETSGYGTADSPESGGWRQEYDEVHAEYCYVHPLCPDKYFPASDSDDQRYYYNARTKEATWTLPEFQNKQSDPGTPQESPESKSVFDSPNDSPTVGRVRKLSMSRSSRTFSVCEPREERLGSNDTIEDFTPKSMSLPRQSFVDGSVVSQPLHGKEWVKTGRLNRTPLTVNGRKLKKQWALSFAKLSTSCIMLDGTDGKLEHNLQLNGAKVKWEKEKSNRKHVFMFSDQLGTQLLLQAEIPEHSKDWYQAISELISKLPRSIDHLVKAKGSPIFTSSPPGSSNHLQMSPSTWSPGSSRKSKLGRSKSTKAKETDSLEDLSSAGDKSKIKDRLRRLLPKRPNREKLIQRGILQNEPVFGCSLDALCKKEKTKVPRFVEHCVELIERNQENMKADGLYRASGNRSKIQKIRCEVDQNKWTAMNTEEDVHVLAGALKLFFREMSDPIIPRERVDKINRAIDIGHARLHKEKTVEKVRKEVNCLLDANLYTLSKLMHHLLKVSQFERFNRMSIANLAIVWGPNLMWSDQETAANLATDMMQQNRVVECLLTNFKQIFT